MANGDDKVSITNIVAGFTMVAALVGIAGTLVTQEHRMTTIEAQGQQNSEALITPEEEADHKVNMALMAKDIEALKKHHP